MIKVENIDVYGFEHAIRGMRNPMSSWARSDSKWGFEMPENNDLSPVTYYIGDNDLDLMKRLYRAGSEHRKYLRQIFVSMDITCSQTMWSQLDTYKIGVTKNSCSKMHKIHVKPFEMKDFSHEGISEVGGTTMNAFVTVLEQLESLRKRYNTTHDKKYWRAIIDMLPMGYNLKATVTMNYENVVTIIKQRTGHKLYEWNEFVKILRELPYVNEIMETENAVE